MESDRVVEGSFWGHRGRARRFAVASVLYAVAFTAACSKQASPAQDASPAPDVGAAPDAGAVPDAGKTSHELTIETYRRFTIVDGDTENAPFLAVQDGDGAWSTVTGVNGVYHVTLASERYGVAVACMSGSLSFGTIFHETVADGVRLRTAGCQSNLSKDAVKLTVVVSHIPLGSSVTVQAGNFLTTSGNDSETAMLDLDVNPGPTEVFATLIDDSETSVKMIRIAPFDVQAAQTITMDFETQGTLLEDDALTVSPDPAASASAETTVFTQTGGYTVGSTRVGTSTYQMLPAALRRPGDRYEVSVSIGTRTSTITTSAPGTLSFVVPPAVADRSFDLVAGPSLRPRWSFATVPPELASQIYFMSASTRGTDSKLYRWSISMKPSWISGATTVQYTLPDFSTVPGFGSDFNLLERTRVFWTIGRFEANVSTSNGDSLERTTIANGVAGSYCGNGVVESPEACDPPDGTTCSNTCTAL